MFTLLLGLFMAASSGGGGEVPLPTMQPQATAGDVQAGDDYNAQRITRECPSEEECG